MCEVSWKQVEGIQAPGLVEIYKKQCKHDLCWVLVDMQKFKTLKLSFFWIYQYGYLSVAVMVQSVIKCSFGDTAVPDLNQHEGTVIMLLHKFHMNF